VGGKKWFLEKVVTKINKRTFVNNFNEKWENTYFIINADNKRV
jgi:hypothetical protein